VSGGNGRSREEEAAVLLVDSSTPPAGGVISSSLGNALSLQQDRLYRTYELGTGRPRDAYFAAAAFISDATRLPCKGIQASPPGSSQTPG
jgi:hypothetical protein